MRIALTEKRDMLGDMMTVKKGPERSQQRMFSAAIAYGIEYEIGSGRIFLTQLRLCGKVRSPFLAYILLIQNIMVTSSEYPALRYHATSI